MIPWLTEPAFPPLSRALREPDGLLAAEESDALAHAAALLGVSDQDWSQHLEELFAAGTLKRDGCGE